VPAVNPDVAIIHVNQADRHGNARIFGASVAPLETAMASKRVIISTEELIDTEEIRREPGRTTIPYFLVDAVVLAPFGAHPGTCPGLYTYDAANLDEFFYGVKSHAEYLDLVGASRLMKLRDGEKIRQGYYL
jgi:glutaconate CoA-transferase subunit A